MTRELFPVVKEVGKQVFVAAAKALSDNSLRQAAMTSNIYGIDFTIEDLRSDHGVGRVYPLPDKISKPLDVKKDGAILEELGARLYVLELENGPTTHHEGKLYCGAPETQFMDLSHQIRALKAMGFTKVEDLVELVTVPEGFQLIVTSQDGSKADIIN